MKPHQSHPGDAEVTRECHVPHSWRPSPGCCLHAWGSEGREASARCSPPRGLGVSR